jgi:hypothetical protein
MVKRLDNLVHGSAPASKWDNGFGPGSSSGGHPSSSSSNWDMINSVIEENEGNDWYIPKEDRYNAWSSPVISTLGNIDKRDFALERKFADMRHKRVESYDKKWQEALDRKDTEYLEKHTCPGLSWTFWSDWTAEEIAYYEDVERFPILKEGYKPNWNLNHPNWSKDKQSN